MAFKSKDLLINLLPQVPTGGDGGGGGPTGGGGGGGGGGSGGDCNCLSNPITVLGGCLCATHPASVCICATHPGTVCLCATHPGTGCFCLTHPATICACLTHPVTGCICATHPATGCFCVTHPVTICQCVSHPFTICPAGSICQAASHTCVGSINPCGVSADPTGPLENADPEQLSQLKEQLQKQIDAINTAQQKRGKGK